MHSLSLLWSARSSKDVKVNVEPLIHISVNHKVFGADLLGSQPLFQCLRLGGSSIFVCAANIQGVISTQPAVPNKNGYTILNYIQSIQSEYTWQRHLH